MNLPYIPGKKHGRIQPRISSGFTGRGQKRFESSEGWQQERSEVGPRTRPPHFLAAKELTKMYSRYTMAFPSNAFFSLD